MPDLTAKRTLVKSPPELWSELSEVERLARHLGAFGEIKITKLEPEHTVAWEGESASGTVSIEPSGWGTKVTLTAQLEASSASSSGLEEAPAAETAADEGEPSAFSPGLEETPVPETAAEEEEPLAFCTDTEEAPAAAETAADEGEPEVEPVVEAPMVEEPVAAEPEPVAPEPAPRRRRRGFLAWLFRPRTSAQDTAPPAPSVPVVEAPAPVEPVAEVPVAEEPVAEEPVAEEPVAQEETAGMAEEPPEREEPTAESEESAPEPEEAAPEPEELIPEPDEPALELEEPPLSEELAAIELASPESGLDLERAQAILDDVLDALGSAHHRPYSRS
jgi:hypothetical protein